MLNYQSLNVTNTDSHSDSDSESCDSASKIEAFIDSVPSELFDKITNISDHSNVPKQESNISVYSWNMWGIPFVSPRTLSQPTRCAEYLLNGGCRSEMCNYTSDIGSMAKTDVTILLAQEIWSWRIGIFPESLLTLGSYCEYIPVLGYILSCLIQLLSHLSGIIVPCCGRWYDAKGRFAQKLKTVLPHAIYSGDIPLRCYLDSGLLILANRRPHESGSQMYELSVHEDYLAAKGFLWAHFKDDSLLVVNTHLQAAGEGDETRIAQLRQLRAFLRRWNGKVRRIVVGGDFNIDMSGFGPLSNPSTKSPSSTLKNSGYNSMRESAPLLMSPKEENRLVAVCETLSNDIPSDVSDAELISTDDVDDEILIAVDENLSSPLQQPSIGDDSVITDTSDPRFDRCKNQRKHLPSFAEVAHTVARHHATECVDIGYELGLVKVSNYRPTFLETNENIDHILTNFQPTNSKTLLFTNEDSKLSDHRLMFVRMEL